MSISNIVIGELYQVEYEARFLCFFVADQTETGQWYANGNTSEKTRVNRRDVVLVVAIASFENLFHRDKRLYPIGLWGNQFLIIPEFYLCHPKTAE